MPRMKMRYCGYMPRAMGFRPMPMGRREHRERRSEHEQEQQTSETIELGMDELEAMRLVDYLGEDQTQAGEKMGISRGTVQRLLYSGRSKVVEALLEGKPIKIQTGEHIEIVNDIHT
ncbi:MAG: DUF134 domain-containing protein [Candidatus Bipolaricaulia bacterium]